MIAPGAVGSVQESARVSVTPNKGQVSCPNLADQVVSAVSHDLRGPTRQIKSFLQLLQANLGAGLDTESSEYIDLIGSAVDTLQAKLDAISRWSRASTVLLQLEEFDLDQIVEGALDQLATQIADAGAAIDVQTGTTVAADRDLMSALFVELFENALKFCEAPVHIEVTSEVDQGTCLVTVSDSGPGFEARNHNDAFELFRKFHLEARPGTGTGLAVVHRILERHGSSPTITSDPSTGTTIQFALPLAGLN